MEYKVNTANQDDIRKHLDCCTFSPPLNTMVNLADYVNKIKQFATTFEAWEHSTLVGLVACYLNNKKTESGYITNVSVLQDYQNQGVAQNLMNLTIKEAVKLCCKTLILEVFETNTLAKKLYQKLGFIIQKNNNMEVQYSTVQYSTVQYSTVQYR
jgi:ribosomal protein S18 acetylase RimI-like enzyme